MRRFFSYLWTGIKYIIGTIIGAISACIQIVAGFLGLLTAVLILTAIVGCAIYIKVRPMVEEARAIAYDKLSSIDDSDFTMLSDTEIYDKDGVMIGLINAGHYEYVEINEISPYIQNGYIAVEDRRYKQHAGVDYVSIMRAFVALMKHNGEITQGGSTITQQVIKNTLLTQEQTYTRKLVEVMVAPYIDQRFGKDKVMEFYCNTNFYGNRCYGVQAASRYYFGKDAKDLDVWEAAMIVGLSNSPATYDPVRHPDKAKEKRNRVLDTMCKEGYIDEDICKNAKNQPLSIVQEYTEGTKENYQTSYAIHCAALELMKNDGFKFQYTFKDKADNDAYKERYSDAYQEKSDLIRAGGYKIYTTLDSQMQEIAQNRLDSGLSRFKEVDETGRYTLQGAAVVVNNQTNYVVAIVGGRGTEDAFNRGYQAVRQPGSTIKPIIDYGPAFDTGEYSPSTIIDDHKWEDGPDNSGSFRGLVTIREALNRSLNTVAWQVLQGIGVDKGLEYLGKLHFMNLDYRDNGVEALSIGGFTNGARVVDMAKAYSALANNGVYDDRTCITSIVYKEQEIFVDRIKTEQVYSEDTAYMLTDVLKGTMDLDYATGRGLDIPGQQAAGKTGTTNSNKDAWFCGYTKYYTTAVWMGYDTPRAMPGVFGATYAGQIWHNLMTDIHGGFEEWDWEQPETVYLANYDSDGKEVDYDTGMQDLFSSSAKIKAAEIAEERRIQKGYEEALKVVEDYEHWFINSVEDTYLLDEKLDGVREKVSLVIDDTNRKDLLERMNAHDKALRLSLNEWQSAINEYESNKEIIEAQRKEEESIAAEENLKNLEKSEKIQAFKLAINELGNLKYLDETNFYRITDKANSKLEDCREYDEYTTLVNDYENAITKYESLPTYTEWQEMERIRLEEEAKRKAEEDRIKQEAADELARRLRGEPNEPGPNTVGPGGNNEYGPGNDNYGPGNVRDRTNEYNRNNSQSGSGQVVPDGPGSN